MSGPDAHAASGPRFLYLHGFASGPESSKGRAFAAHFAARGLHVERLDLRRIHPSAMVAKARAAIGGDLDRAVLFGSSLGGLVAARTAEEDPRVCALVLLAPAFRMVERWRLRGGGEEWRRWEETGVLVVDDYATGGKLEVDFGFARDAEALDARSGGWPDVRVPTLIVHGTHDDVVDPTLSATWASGKRFVRRLEVDDGHELKASVPILLAEAERFLGCFMGPASQGDFAAPASQGDFADPASRA